MNKTILLITIFLVFFTISCSDNKKEIIQIEDLIKENALADSFEDIDRFMATLDESFPHYSSLKEVKSRLYVDWDFNYKIEKIDIRTIDDNTAVVDVIKLISKKKGDEFIDNRNYLEYSLIKKNDIWRINNMVIKKSDKVRKSN